MKYLFHFKNANNPKNKLETEIYAYLKGSDRLVIMAEDLERVKAATLYQVKCLNEKYSRSKPVPVAFKPSTFNDDIHVFVGTGDTSPVNLTLLAFDK